jgi:hypothetical protein
LDWKIDGAEKVEIESDRLSRISHPEQLAVPIGRAANLSGLGFGHRGAATRPV